MCWCDAVIHTCRWLAKLAVLVPVHACTQQHYGVCMCGMYVTPQIGINTKPVWGATWFGIRPQTDMGIPIPVWGLAFFKFFQSRTRSAFSRQKFRQSQCHGAPLLVKNLVNQHTAPAIQELGKQEKGRLLRGRLLLTLTSLMVFSSQADNSTANNFSYLQFWLRSPI